MCHFDFAASEPCCLVHYGLEQVRAAIAGIQGDKFEEVLTLGAQPPVTQPSATDSTRHSTRVTTVASPAAADPLCTVGVHGRKPQPTKKALRGIDDPESMALGLPDAHAVTQLKGYLALNGGY